MGSFCFEEIVDLWSAVPNVIFKNLSFFWYENWINGFEFLMYLNWCVCILPLGLFIQLALSWKIGLWV